MRPPVGVVWSSVKCQPSVVKVPAQLTFKAFIALRTSSSSTAGNSCAREVQYVKQGSGLRTYINARLDQEALEALDPCLDKRNEMSL
jgi:multidrug efflux pump subunit AcrA (membrane-fusion protein)